LIKIKCIPSSKIYKTCSDSLSKNKIITPKTQLVKNPNEMTAVHHKK